MTVASIDVAVTVASTVTVAMIGAAGRGVVGERGIAAAGRTLAVAVDGAVVGIGAHERT